MLEGVCPMSRDKMVAVYFRARLGVGEQDSNLRILSESVEFLLKHGTPSPEQDSTL